MRYEIERGICDLLRVELETGTPSAPNGGACVWPALLRPLRGSRSRLRRRGRKREGIG